jgi:hypothetical protein
MEDMNRISSIEWYTWSKRCPYRVNTGAEDHNGDDIVICIHDKRMYCSSCNIPECPLTLREFRNLEPLPNSDRGTFRRRLAAKKEIERIKRKP